MTYLEKYPQCVGCPVSKHCGTSVSSIRLCNSYKEEPEDTTEEEYPDWLVNDLQGDYDDAMG